jgi:hypothetical protein
MTCNHARRWHARANFVFGTAWLDKSQKTWWLMFPAYFANTTLCRKRNEIYFA